MRSQVTGSVYCDQPTVRSLHASPARLVGSTALKVEASVTVHHVPTAGVQVCLSFPDFDAVRAYAQSLIELADETDRSHGGE